MHEGTDASLSFKGFGFACFYITDSQPMPPFSLPAKIVDQFTFNSAPAICSLPSFH